MRPIQIDFAPASLERTLRLSSPLTWGLLLMAIVLWAGVAFKANQLAHQKERAAADLKQVLKQTQTRLQEREAKKLAASQFSIPESQANAINAAIAQLNLPWRDLFDAIEAATPADIALLAVEPDAKKHLLRGTAEAKSSEEMIAYIEQLKKQTLFTSVLLTRHEINEQDPNKPMRFQFEAEWAGGRQ
ncbi:MAG: hypothetical protein HYS18_13080 [Burkholderiales bacterium]|nr:hypothetical protein [Burkholderiales bacterium]